jgi:alpha-D-xyloside xylohydrolase
MRIHGDRRPTNIPVYRKDGTQSLFTGSPNEVWSYGEEVYAILKKYLELRESMRPYIRGLMREAHEKGAPLMRPMFFEFPGDTASWELKDQYMFGPDMLVAPVMEAKQTERAVYLPAGAEWTELHSSASYPGGAAITVAAPLEVIPVFLKDGRHKELTGKI